MRDPDVSVVVPAHRQARFLSGCLDSIAAQSHRGHVEVVVVDDGCPEGSGEVAARHPLGPRVVRQPNRGVAAARNAGIAASRGRWVAFLDADDRWLSDKLSLQLARLEASPRPALCFTRYERVDEHGHPLERCAHPGAIPAPGAPSLFCESYVGCLTAVVDRRCLEAVGGFPESASLARGGQDYALWLRIALRFSLLYEPEVLARYTVHGRSRVGVDPMRNFRASVRAVREVWELDGALCRRRLRRPCAWYLGCHGVRLLRSLAQPSLSSASLAARRTSGSASRAACSSGSRVDGSRRIPSASAASARTNGSE